MSYQDCVVSDFCPSLFATTWAADKLPFICIFVVTRHLLQHTHIPDILVIAHIVRLQMILFRHLQSRRVVPARTVLPWEEARRVGQSRAWPPRSRFGSSDRGRHPCGPNPTPTSQTRRRARTDAPPAQHHQSQRGCGSRPPALWLGASVCAPSPSCIPRSWQ